MTRSQPPAFPLDGDWVDVRDIAQAFRLVVEKPLATSERFVLASGSQTTDEVAAFATSGDADALRDMQQRIDTTKAPQLLGWKTQDQEGDDARHARLRQGGREGVLLVRSRQEAGGGVVVVEGQPSGGDDGGCGSAALLCLMD